MRMFVVLLAVSCWLSAVSAQWLETTINLPDSLGQARHIQTMLYDSARGTVYVGLNEGRCVLAIEAATSRVLARIPAGPNVRALCLNPLNRKVYTVDFASGTVTIIDADARTERARLSVPAQPIALCYNPRSNLVYCACYSGTVVAIDGASDLVVASVTGLSSTYALCYSAAGNKLYCARNNTRLVSVVDCSTHTVLRSVTVGSGPCALVHNSTDNKVYAACYGSNTIAIVDGTNDSLRASIATSESPVCLAWNSATDRVYCGSEDGDSLAVVDGATDTVVKWLSVGSVAVMEYSRSTNRLFVVGDYLHIINGSNDSVMIRDQTYWSGLCVASAQGLVYCTYGTQVAALDDRWAVCQYELGTVFLPEDLCWSPASGKLYCSARDANGVAVVDGSSLAPLHTIWGVEDAGAMCWDAQDNKLFCGAAEGYNMPAAVLAVDCVADSVVGMVREPGVVTRLVWGSVGNRVYALHSHSDALSVIDAGSDSLIARVTVPGFPSVMFYAPSVNRLYCTGGEYLSTVDCGTLRVDTVLRGLLSGGALAALGAPTNRLYVVPWYRDTVYVVDMTQNLVVDRIVTGLLDGVAGVSPRSNKLYCLSRSDSLYVIDCLTNALTGSISIGAVTNPRFVCYDSVNDRLYLGSSGSQMVGVVDCRTDRLVATVPVGDIQAIAVDPINLRTFVANQNQSSISVIRDSLRVGVEGRATPYAIRSAPEQTVVHGVLNLSASPRHRVSASLLDATGRRVMALRSGTNDISRLSPGVYFVRWPSAVGREPSAVTKVVIAR